MSYEPTIWKKGDKVTSTKLNKIENGIQGNDTEISNLKEDLNSIQTATASDVGKALKAKTVTDGKVTEWEFGEAGGADPSVIEEAVADWLDEHPEATTTVPDGSLTEEKFSEPTQLKVLNNFVTPEMFGAKGDGVTDDAPAINAMFASSNTIFRFGNKTYLTNDAVTCNKTCEIYFDNTTILAKKSYGLRSFEYVIGFTAPRIITYGKLTVLANTSVNIGIWLANIGGSRFENLDVNNARIWGLYIDRTTNSNNSLSIKSLGAFQCGFKAHGKATRIDSGHLRITDISGSFTGYSDDIREGLFNNEYAHANLVIDDSLYENVYSLTRYVFYHNGDNSGFTLDEDDISKATFYANAAGSTIPSDYGVNDVARDVFIPIGGGVCLGSKNSEGVYHIEKLATQSNPMSTYISLGYGGKIGSYASEYDTIIMHNESLITTIGYTYFEAVGNGYSNAWGDSRDRIYVFTQTTNIRMFFENPFVGASRLPIQTGNVVMNYTQGNREAIPVENYVSCPNFLVRKIIGINGLSDDNVGIAFQANTIDEFTPRNVTFDLYGVTDFSQVKINLRELNITNKTNSFDPITFFIRRRRTNSDYDNFVITLTTALVNAGYSIHGAVDNKLTIHPSEYGNFAKITIILFRYDKTFFVTAEPLTFVDGTQA